MGEWTQPLCGTCWIAYDLGFAVAERREFIAAPIRVKDPEEETCVACGSLTTSGIYIRVNPGITKVLRALRGAAGRSGARTQSKEDICP